MSDLDNDFFLRRVGIKKQRKTVGIAADGGYTCPLHSLRGTRFGKAAPPASIGRLAPYNPGQVCHRSRKAFYVARPRAYVASLSLTHCYGNAGHKRSFSAHSTAVSVPGALFVRRHRSRIYKMLLCGRGAGQPPAPPGRSRLAHPVVFTQGFHKRQSRPCVSLLVALSPLSSASAFQGTRSHFRLAQNACAVAPSPRPVKPRPTRVPPALPRLPSVACSCLSSSPPGAFSKPLRGIASPGASAAPGVFPPSFLRRSKLKACKLKASYQQVKSFLTHSPRPRPSEGARSRFVISYAYPW